MSIDTRAVIIVGLPRSELIENEVDHGDDLNEWAEANGMAVLTPYYDCDDDAAVVIGFRLAETDRYSADEINLRDLAEDAVAKKAEFAELTGLMPCVFLMPWVF